MSPVVQTVLGLASGEASLDGGDQLHQRNAGILTDRHAGGAGVVLLALELDAEAAAADDGGNDAKAEVVVLQVGALLDMGFQVAVVAGFFHCPARAASEPGFA